MMPRSRRISIRLLLVGALLVAATTAGAVLLALTWLDGGSELAVVARPGIAGLSLVQESESDTSPGWAGAVAGFGLVGLWVLGGIVMLSRARRRRMAADLDSGNGERGS